MGDSRLGYLRADKRPTKENKPYASLEVEFCLGENYSFRAGLGLDAIPFKKGIKKGELRFAPLTLINNLSKSKPTTQNLRLQEHCGRFHHPDPPAWR